ncbi:MAG: response regulator transcription factor [Actinomycetota bacterium]|nr:response regulator transcription factor [Actinomycetota bacterium]
MLESAPGVEVVGEARDGAEAVALAARLQPDVVLMDLRMPKVDGVTAAATLRQRHPDLHVLVLTTYETDADILRAVEAGATGYLLKDASRDELLEAVHAAAAGRSVLAPRVASRLMARLRSPLDGALSAREIEVLALVARGQTNKEIARALHVSQATVKTHLLHLFAKLGVDDRTAAVTTALERGILRLDH